MKFTDFTPPAAPTHEQQRDALQKGLGRAVQWARAGVLDGGLLREACLNDLRYDTQVEDNRGEWLWMLMSDSDRTSELRDPVLSALRSISTDAHAYQLCELGFHFARSGDEAFLAALYDFVGKRQAPEDRSIGEEQLLELDGEDAFRFIVRLRGRHLEAGEWDWDDDAIVDNAMERCGEERIREILTGSTDPDVRRFTMEWQKHRPAPIDLREERQSYDQRLRATSAADLIREGATETEALSHRGWGMRAAEAELMVVLEQLRREQDPDILARLLTVFSNRPLPEVDARFLELCRHPNERVRRRALKALEQNSHPLVREFAMDGLRAGTLGPWGVGLFTRNFEPGDEQRLLDQLELPNDADHRHSMLLDAIDVLEGNENADCLELGQIAYFHTPCSRCRSSAARLLADRQRAPAWLIEECREEAQEACRTLGSPPEDE